MKQIPGMGLGTWQNSGTQCAKAVETAVDTGYRHIDTAQMYRNEEFVGQGIENSSVPREEIFLATKVWHDRLKPGKVVSSTEESLRKLGTDYLDLLYIHWPAGDYSLDTFDGFNQLVDEGRIENIGVSNFSPAQVEEAMERAEIFANQVEMHPLLQQEEMVEFCQRNDITLVAYSPLARGRVLEILEINEIAEKHGTSPAQVSLAWLNSKENVVPIPKASSREHIQDNWEARNLELDAEDIEKIESISQEHRVVNPGFMNW